MFRSERDKGVDMILGNDNRSVAGRKAASILVLTLVCLMMFLVVVALDFLDAQAAESEGAVSIDLKELSEPDEELHVGQSVDRRFEISSMKDECYIRLRSDIDDISGASLCRYMEPEEEGWLRCDDGWWYFKRSLSIGGSATFSSDMVICDERNMSALQRMNTIRFSETITAEAIDARAVLPEWDSGKPWDNITSEEMPPKDTAVLGATNDPISDVDKTRGFRVLKGLAQTSDDSYAFVMSLLATLFALCVMLILGTILAAVGPSDYVENFRDVGSQLEDADERKE